MALKFLEPVELLEPTKRGRPRLPMRQPGVERVMAMVELRDHMKGLPAKWALEDARKETWQETKTKAGAFLLFVLLAGAMVLFMWAGVRGGG